MQNDYEVNKNRIDKSLLALISFCFIPNNTVSRYDYLKEYMYGCRKQGWFAMKVGDTIIEKWSDNASSYIKRPDIIKEINLCNSLLIEVEHENFLATVIVNMKGGHDPSYVSGTWTFNRTFIPTPISNIQPVSFSIANVDFIGDVDSLENEALLVILSHDFS